MTTESYKVFEGPDTLVWWKESGIPTVPLRDSEGETLLSIAARENPEILGCHGQNEWEGGVIHRLDSLTQGLVLIARKQKAYDALFQQQRKDMIEKEYRAYTTEGRAFDDGFEPFPFDIASGPCEITSSFRSFGPKGRSVRPVLANMRNMPKNGRIYTTAVVPSDDNLFICTITRGFRHQIRSHLAWAGFPIAGDLQYGGTPSDTFGLESVSITYIEPCSGRKLTITV